ncbi:MAG: DUF2244 domain-containing protein [Hyphomonadaceae bacterium]|nr:DUF2244 domain-containing protein [Hyphomonadaceae bacterium]
MAPRWERTDNPPELEAPVFLDTVLRPHRSLSAAAFKLMLGAVIAINLVVAIVFVAQGAYPVAGFLGLDVLALWLAFHLNYRAARAQERVQVARAQVQLTRSDPKGASKHWVLNPIWAQIRQDAAGVAIRSGGGEMRVGAFLPPDERGRFAAALREALFRAKRGY